MKKIGVVIIGCGFIASTAHLPSFKRISECEVLAVVSRKLERARETAEKFGIKHFFTDYKEALKLKDIDVVDVCTPTYVHRQTILDAFAHGKHVLCEKPIALKLKDAKEMTNKARKAGVKFMVAHCLRFWPEYVKVKQLIENGEIGEPIVARAYRQFSFPKWGMEGWHEDLYKSGGVFVDMSIHDVDFLRWTLGDVERVYAQGGRLLRKDVTAHDYVQAFLGFKGGKTAYVEGSWALPDGYPFTTYLEVAGTDGLLFVDNKTTATLEIHSKGRRETFTPTTEDAYFLELKHFIDCVINDEEPAVSGEDARKSLEVSLAAVKSIKESKPVYLPLKEEVL